MSKDKIIGKWETEQKLLSAIDLIVVFEFLRDGSIIATGNYRNPVLKAIMALWDLKMKGSWYIGTDGKLRTNLQGLTTYPTRLVDQLLRTFRIQISADEFVSVLSVAFITLIGANSENGTSVEFPDENIMIMGNQERVRFYRRG